MPFTALVGEGAKLDVHGCETVDMASSFGKALLEFSFIVLAAVTVLLGINASKNKAVGKVLFPATFVTGLASISYFSMASGGGWVIAPDCRQLFIARYMDWVITTPLILICLGVVAGVNKWDIMALCLSDGEAPIPTQAKRARWLDPPLPSSQTRRVRAQKTMRVFFCGGGEGGNVQHPPPSASTQTLTPLPSRAQCS